MHHQITITSESRSDVFLLFRKLDTCQKAIHIKHVKHIFQASLNKLHSIKTCNQSLALVKHLYNIIDPKRVIAFIL